MDFAQIFQAARNKTCAFNLAETETILKLSRAQLIAALKKRGFTILSDLNPCLIIKYLREKVVGKALYKRGAKLDSDMYDCSSLALFAYEQAGIWLPRLSIQQSYYAVGKEIDIYSLKPFDLIFTKTNHINRYISDPTTAIGHVLLYTGKEHHTVIHAANKQKGIVEERAELYLHSKQFQRARRIIFQPESWVIVSIPENREIHSSDDIFWNLLYAL